MQYETLLKTVVVDFINKRMRDAGIPEDQRREIALLSLQSTVLAFLGDDAFAKTPVGDGIEAFAFGLRELAQFVLKHKARPR
jgi:hypothetical protein